MPIKQYRVIGVKGETNEEGEVKMLPIQLTGTKGTFGWDPGSFVTDIQVTEEDVDALIADGKLELVTE